VRLRSPEVLSPRFGATSVDSASLSFIATANSSDSVASVVTGCTLVSAAKLASRVASSGPPALSSFTEKVRDARSFAYAVSKRSACSATLFRVPPSVPPAARSGDVEDARSDGASVPNETSNVHVTSGRNHGVSSLRLTCSSPWLGREPTFRYSILALNPKLRKPNSTMLRPASM
jgi:hypothetical protein